MPAQIEKKKKESSLTDKVSLLLTLMEAFQDDISEIEKKIDAQQISINKLNSRHGL
tara:strand:- start:410 stop:577 length:168 start_codon:yes stop_codon:yes gene_type:complete